MSLAALPLILLTVVGFLFAVLGLLNGAIGVAFAGLAALAVAAAIGALASRPVHG